MTRALAWLLAAFVVLAPGLARAIEYEIFIDIDGEEDLLELLNTDQIDEDTFNSLLELLRRGVDLDTADREALYTLPNLSYEDVDGILGYRDEAGGIRDPAVLVPAGVLSQRKLASIAAFLVVPRETGAKVGADGFARFQGIWTVEDRRAPPMFLQARVTTLRHLTVGATGTLVRNRIGPAAYDPARDALSADPMATRVRLPKYFVQWDTERWGIIAGTYRIGFGQRLTFDSTSRYTPNGFLLDDAVTRRYDLTRLCKESTGELDESPCPTEDAVRVTPDYVFRPGHLGVAAGAKHLPLPRGWAQAYGWFSFQNKDLYQYKAYRPDRCTDPDLDEDPACAAPDVYVRRDPPLEPRSEHAYQTLPNVYDEILGGANVAYYFDRRTHVGVTGYGADSIWRPRGIDLDFQEWDRTPYGGAYGAAGADASWGYRWADVFAEIAHSFDSMREQTPEQGGGGLAAILRHTITQDVHEFEITGRYYDTDYANPYAGSIAQADLYDGLRARDEAGGRVRYSSRLAERVDLFASADFWAQVSLRRSNADINLRSDVRVTRWWRPGLRLQFRRRDLSPRGTRTCIVDAGSEFATDVSGLSATDLSCGGQRFSVWARSRFDPIRRLYFMLQYRHCVGPCTFGDPSSDELLGEDQEIVLVDLPPDVDELVQGDRILLDQPIEARRQDINTFLTIGANPIDPLRLRGRVRWLWQDISDNGNLEHSVWTYVDVSYTIRRWAIPRLRYDVVMFLDSRDSTADRVPNPEHWLLLEFASRF